MTPQTPKKKKHKVRQGDAMLALSKTLQLRREKGETLSPKEEEIANEESRRFVMQKKREERKARHVPAGPKNSLNRSIIREDVIKPGKNVSPHVVGREVLLHATKGTRTYRSLR